MFQLHIANQIFSQLADFERDFSGLSEMEKAALDFCKAWLSGQENFIQQTSGSTGTPKKIELTREQMQASAAATGSFFQIHSESQLHCCLNPAYIAGKMMLVRAVVWDCPIWLVEPSGNPLKGLEFIPDFVAMVPMQVEKALTNAKSLEVLQQVGNLIIGGAPISATLKNQLIENQIRAWQTYGMTETVSHVALAKITDKALIYQTLPDVEIGVDEREALWVKSPMSGPDPIQTNDLVELFSSTTFRWLGRADFVVNSGGIKLHPELLEAKAEAAVHALFPGVRFFFYGEKDEKLGEKLVLVLEAETDEEKSRHLLKQLQPVLGQYEVPKNIYFRRSFTVTASGKINRNLSFENR